MGKQDKAKPVNDKKCQSCSYYNHNKNQCTLKTCIDQLSLFDYVGNRL